MKPETSRALFAIVVYAIGMAAICTLFGDLVEMCKQNRGQDQLLLGRFVGLVVLCGAGFALTAGLAVAALRSVKDSRHNSEAESAEAVALKPPKLAPLKTLAVPEMGPEMGAAERRGGSPS